MESTDFGVNCREIWATSVRVLRVAGEDSAAFATLSDMRQLEDADVYLCDITYDFTVDEIVALLLHSKASSFSVGVRWLSTRSRRKFPISRVAWRRTRSTGPWRQRARNGRQGMAEKVEARAWFSPVAVDRSPRGDCTPFGERVAAPITFSDVARSPATGISYRRAKSTTDATLTRSSSSRSCRCSSSVCSRKVAGCARCRVARLRQRW